MQEVLEELGGDIFVDLLCRANSNAMRIRFSEYIAIQLVPSA